ncbi:hypothetical protein [Flagellimonas meridianipacifica]|uniref:Acyl carrier protein n=1 Tax=Flagellimonas meridianipacifica TaxID=1080225 RepID=A0A2T0MFN6_9FLAO|nr:hypothetical protein [Allomuricauda pacifica]PRX56391.1 hypothetical protein CLV81_0388 [Allomuricauda pacifica]
MVRTDILHAVKSTINSYFPGEEDFELSIGDKLHILLSESTQALSLITSLEDEFEIEFNDDDIDMDFFLSVEVITEKIMSSLKQDIRI